MTNEEVKARALILSFLGQQQSNLVGFEKAKQSALICVNEIIETYSKYKGMHDQEFFDSDLNYYKQVEKEIKNL